MTTAAQAIETARWVDAQCDAYETALLAGRSPDIKSFLGDAPPQHRRTLLTELLAIEFEFRLSRQESLQPTEYERRFPELASADIAVLIETAQARVKNARRSPLPETVLLPTSESQQTPGASNSERRSVRYLGDYELIREIARGGMGVVFEARQCSLNRPVALKMILSGQLASTEQVARFRREAEAVAQLDHPGIVPIYEVGLDGDQHYFSMGYVTGPSLSTRLQTGPLEPHEAARWLRDVAFAIQYAHERGVVHRDLKPSNILLSTTTDERTAEVIVTPRVTDFGLAKLAHSTQSITESGQILGTPSYMPPEQAAGLSGEVGAAADIYALGAVLYACLTGRPPFQSASAVDTVRQVLERDPVSVRELNVAIPADLETICMKCLEKSIPRRYATARDVGDELQRFLEQRPILARPIRQHDRLWRWCRRNPTVARLSLALTLSLLVGAIVSTVFALRERTAAREALKQAGVARDRERDAQKSEQAAQRAEQTTRETLTQTEAQRQQAVRELARARQRLYAADIQHAALALARGDVAETLRYLEQQQPDSVGADLRQWEWYYLRSQCFGFDATYAGHERAVESVAWNADGTRFAACDADGNVSIWQPQQERPRHLIRTDLRQALRLNWDSSGRHLVAYPRVLSGANRSQRGATTSDGRQCVVMDADGGRVLLKQPTLDVVWHASQPMLVGVDTASGLWRWTVGNESAERLPIFNQAATALAWLPQSEQLAVGTEKEIVIIDSATGEQLRALPIGLTSTDPATNATTSKPLGPIGCLAVSSNGNYLAAASRNSGTRTASPMPLPSETLAVWNLKSNELLRHWRIRSTASRLKWHRDGVRLLVAPESTIAANITLHHVAQVEPLLTVDGFDADWHATRDWFTVSDRLGLSVFDADFRSTTPTRVLRGHLGPVYAVSSHPSDDRLISGGADLTVRSWPVNEDSVPKQLAPQTVVSISPNRQWQIIRRTEKGVTARTELIEVATQRLLLGIEHEISPKVDWSPDSRRAVLLTHGQIGPGPKRIAPSFAVWDTSSGQSLWTVENQDLRSFAWSPDGDQLLVSKNRIDSPLQVISVRGEPLKSEWLHTGTVFGIAWSPSGTCWACATAEKFVDGRGTRTQLEVRDFDGQLTQTFDVPDHFNPRFVNPVFLGEGRLVAWTAINSQTNKSRIFVWDIVSRALIAELDGHEGSIVQLAASPLDLRLASNDLKSVKLWDVSQGLELLDLGGPTFNSLQWSTDGQSLLSQQRHWHTTVGHKHAAKLPRAAFTNDLRPMIGGGFF